MYEIVSTETVVESVVSYQVLNGASYFSSSHCQAGQGGIIYKLNQIRNTDTNTNTKKRKEKEMLQEVEFRDSFAKGEK